MNPQIKRFFLACLGLSLFLTGLFEFGRYFWGVDLLPSEQTKGFLLAAIANAFVGGSFVYRAWEIHRKIRTGEAKAVPSIYPRTEAGLYGVGALITFGGAAILIDSLNHTFSNFDLWERLKALSMIGSLMVAGAGCLVIGAQLLRSKSAKPLEPRE